MHQTLRAAPRVSRPRGALVVNTMTPTTTTTPLGINSQFQAKLHAFRNPNMPPLLFFYAKRADATAQGE